MFFIVCLILFFIRMFIFSRTTDISTLNFTNLGAGLLLFAIVFWIEAFIIGPEPICFDGLLFLGYWLFLFGTFFLILGKIVVKSKLSFRSKRDRFDLGSSFVTIGALLIFMPYMNILSLRMMLLPFSCVILGLWVCYKNNVL